MFSTPISLSWSGVAVFLKISLAISWVLLSNFCMFLNRKQPQQQTMLLLAFSPSRDHMASAVMSMPPLHRLKRPLAFAQRIRTDRDGGNRGGGGNGKAAAASS